MDGISVEELLEQAERQADEKAAAAARQRDSDDNEDHVNITTEAFAHADRPQHRSRGRRYHGPGPSNTNRYSTEREENDERRSRRSRDLADDDVHDDEDVKGGSDKGSANGSVRSRRRSRSPRHQYLDRRDPRNTNLGSYRERDRLAPRGDSYSGGGRMSRAREDDRHYSPGAEDDQPRRDTRRGSDDARRGSDDREKYHSGGGRRHYSGPARKKDTPEPTDDERDRRTVFVQQLAARLRSKDLLRFFEQAGAVADAQIVKDRVSGKSKGVGYVEFKDEDSVQKAIALTGQKLMGIPIIAQLTEAEKNRQSRTTEGGATHSNGIPFHRLYVGNIQFSVSEEALRGVFEGYGELEFCTLQKDDTNRSKGYGFVQYVDPANAKQALEELNNFVLAGRPIRVGLGNDKFTPESTRSLLQRFGSQAQQQGSSFSGMGGRGAHAGGTANFDRASGKDQDKMGGASALDDTDVSGVNFSNYSRDALMRKLARTDEPEPKIAPKMQAKQAPIEQPAPSRCVLLKHMFDQAKEAAENPKNWQKELEEDVREECEQKYGIVVHIGIALDSDDGEIYIKFDRVQGGENAIRGLNGRYFNGNMISAQYVVDHVYNMMFPTAANR